MYLPSYQWISIVADPECDFCDEVYLPHDFDFKFQIAFSPTTTVENSLSTNPSDLVTLSSGAFAFDILSLPATTKEFIIYLCGKVFRFKANGATPGGVGYTVAITGDVYEITVEGTTAAEYRTGLTDAIIATIDSVCGTSTIIVVNTIGIYGVTGTAYISDPETVLSNIVTSTPSGFVAENFIYDIEGKICYDKFIFTSNYFQLPPLALTAGKRYVFSMDYSLAYTGMTIYLRIEDGTNPAQIEYFTVSPTTLGTATVFFDTLISSNHTLSVWLVDPSNNNVGFCVIGYSLTSIDGLSKLEVEDCYGTITELEYAESYNGDVNSLITPLGSITGVFRFILTDTLNQTITSRWYEVVNQASCSKGRLIKLTWSHDCVLGDLDYLNLPFTNEYLLTGVKIKQPVDKVEGVGNVTASGKKKSIYRHTIAVYELRFHPYTESTQAIIERAFEHKNITINDEIYWVSDAEVYQTTEVDNAVYTGRIDLYKDGTELIVSSCCCAVEQPVYSGGTGI